MSTTETTTTSAPTELQKGHIGQSIPRKEDRRLVQGQGTFFDDVRRHGMGYVHFVRSPHAHAKIVSIDVAAALALDGVYGTLTGDEVRWGFEHLKLDEAKVKAVMRPSATFNAALQAASI